jgi:hypothetical protein
MEVGGTKPVRGEVLWAERGRDGGQRVRRAGELDGWCGWRGGRRLGLKFFDGQEGTVAGAAGGIETVLELEKEFGLQEADLPRGYFTGSRYMSSF